MGRCRSTRRTRDGIVEGDAHYVLDRYERHCSGVWNGTCLLPEREGSRSPPAATNGGMLKLFRQPYISGLNFVRTRYDIDGWDSVNAVYDDIPTSTEQIIHPSRYPDETFRHFDLDDSSTEDWELMTAGGQSVTKRVGEAGLFVALWYPNSVEERNAGPIPLRGHSDDDGAGERTQPVTFNYTHRYSDDWDGDRLQPYVSADSDETAYVFATAWDSRSDAEEFRNAWVQTLRYWNAEPVESRVNTYRIPDGERFEDAFSIELNGTRVTIVNAPTVADLSAVREGAAPLDTVPNGTYNDVQTVDRPTSGGGGPGFGMGTALLATLSAFAAFVVVLCLRD